MKLLQSHINNIEARLLCDYRVSSNAGHNSSKGTARESFVQVFLKEHLAASVAIGAGSIFDCNSEAKAPRPQIDIVVYKRSYPKIKFSDGIEGFMAESVVATIEVKSILDKEALRQAVLSAVHVKGLQRNIVTIMRAGHTPPAILNYVVAYAGPSTMETVLRWLIEIQLEEDISPFPSKWPIANPLDIPSPSVDGIFVLGKGGVLFVNSMIGINLAIDPTDHVPLRWDGWDHNEDNLYSLFLLLTFAFSGLDGGWLHIHPYAEMMEQNGRKVFSAVVGVPPDSPYRI